MSFQKKIAKVIVDSFKTYLDTHLENKQRLNLGKEEIEFLKDDFETFTFEELGLIKKTKVAKPDLDEALRCVAKTSKGERCKARRSLNGKDTTLCMSHNKNGDKSIEQSKTKGLIAQPIKKKSSKTVHSDSEESTSTFKAKVKNNSDSEESRPSKKENKIKSKKTQRLQRLTNDSDSDEVIVSPKESDKVIVSHSDSE